MSEDHDSGAPHEWAFGPCEVVQSTKTGRYHRVGDRFIQADTGERYYRIWDATHTSRETIWEGDAVEDYLPVRVSITHKPASVFGKRVRGVLYGPNEEPNLIPGGVKR